MEIFTTHLKLLACLLLNFTAHLELLAGHMWYFTAHSLHLVASICRTLRVLPQPISFLIREPVMAALILCVISPASRGNGGGGKVARAGGGGTGNNFE
jgi:hypothetical protein